MSGTTTNLELFKYNPNTDGDQTFNIDSALNDNWDSLDTLIGALTNLTTTQKASLVGAINELVTNLGGKAAKDLGNLDATGQAIIDAKIEAEALAAQNGYIKFKLNGISNPLIIQWGFSNNLTSSITLPISYTTYYCPVCTMSIYNDGTAVRGVYINTKTLSSFSVITNFTGGNGVTVADYDKYWITIGY